MKTPRFLVAACVSLALAFTFSCSSDSSDDPVPVLSSSSDDGDGSSSSSAVSDHFNPNITYGSLTDSRDQKNYRTIVIGTQTLMAENLNYDVPDNETDVCYLNNASNCETYGRLYNWATAMANSASSSANPSGVQGVCPDGWHLPSDAEWAALITAVGTTPGYKLKATSGWGVGGGSGGSDDFGFSALPGGGRSFDGSFYRVGEISQWWSSTERDSGYAYGWYMDWQDNNKVFGSNAYKAYLKSVRCLQD